MYPTALDLLLTVTLFRTSLSVSFFAMLGLLMASKCFHWLVNKRVEFMGQFPMTPLSHYIRLGTFMILLASVDALVVVKSVEAVWTETRGFSQLFTPETEVQGPSIHILYGFEFSVLLIVMIAALVRSGLILWELWVHQGRWDDKSTYIMYSDFFADVTQFGIYAIFFLTLYAHVGLPITLVRPLLVAFANFRKRVADLLRYRQATQNMEQRFPEATAEELAGSMCIICREDMTHGRKLPCGHILHLRCLREWLEHQQTCPTCRVPVLEDPNAIRQGEGMNVPNLGAHNHAPAAAAAHNAPNVPPNPFFFQNGLGPFGPMPQPGFAYHPGLQHHPFHQAFLAQQLAQFNQAQQQQQQHQQQLQQPPHTTLPAEERHTSPPPAAPVALSASSFPSSSSQSPSIAESSSTTTAITSSSSLSHTTNPVAPVSASAIPADIAQDILELTTSIVRDLDSIRARMDVLTALMNSNGIHSPPSLRSGVPSATELSAPSSSAQSNHSRGHQDTQTESTTSDVIKSEVQNPTEDKGDMTASSS